VPLLKIAYCKRRKVGSLAVEATSESSRDSCCTGGPKNPRQREAAKRVRDTLDSRARGRYVLSEVDSDVREDTPIR